jgi:hypothetical protein
MQAGSTGDSQGDRIRRAAIFRLRKTALQGQDESRERSDQITLRLSKKWA